MKLKDTTEECRKEAVGNIMTAAKPDKGIARKPMRMQLRTKKFKPNNKFNRRKQERAVKKLLTK